jgi:hypothetical protein
MNAEEFWVMVLYDVGRGKCRAGKTARAVPVWVMRHVRTVLLGSHRVQLLIARISTPQSWIVRAKTSRSRPSLVC